MPIDTGDAGLTAFRHRGVLCVQLEAFTLQSQSDVERFGRELTALLDRFPQRTLVIEFSKVDRMPSAALGELAAHGRALRKRAGVMRLVKVRPQIYEVFVVSGLYKLFEFHDDLVSATRGRKKSWWRWWGW